MTPVGMPYDLKAKCSWDGDLLHIELPETPKAIHVHHPCGSTFFGVPTGVEQELRSENAKLREYMRKLVPELCEQNAELHKENAELRELVRDAWGSGHPDKSCGDCEIRDECHAEIEEAHKKGNGRWNTRCLFERRIEDRMRELGIEVVE